jgi:septal ring factor EnvC (AmiA/AmiB activator)
MVSKSEIEKQLDFLQKDRVQVQSRLDQASDEIKQLDRTLANLDGAIQVSNHYLSMIDNKVDDGTIKSSKSDKKVKK